MTYQPANFLQDVLSYLLPAANRPSKNEHKQQPRLNPKFQAAGSNSRLPTKFLLTDPKKKFFIFLSQAQSPPVPSFLFQAASPVLSKRRLKPLPAESPLLVMGA